MHDIILVGDDIVMLLN